MINQCASSTAQTRSSHPNPMKPEQLQHICTVGKIANLDFRITFLKKSLFQIGGRRFCLSGPGSWQKKSPTPNLKKWFFQKCDPKIKICDFCYSTNMLKLLGFHGIWMGASCLGCGTRTVIYHFSDTGALLVSWRASHETGIQLNIIIWGA